MDVALSREHLDPFFASPKHFYAYLELPNALNDHLEFPSALDDHLEPPDALDKHIEHPEALKYVKYFDTPYDLKTIYDLDDKRLDRFDFGSYSIPNLTTHTAPYHPFLWLIPPHYG